MIIKQIFTAVLCVLLMACNSVKEEPLQQETLAKPLRISLTGSFEDLRSEDGMRSIGFELGAGLDEDETKVLSFGSEATHKAVLIVRNKQTKQTYRKLVKLKKGDDSKSFKLEGEFVFDTDATPFDEGEWSLMIATAGREDLIKEKPNGGATNYEVWGEAFLDTYARKISDDNRGLLATSLPYVSKWVDLEISEERTQADVKNIILRPFGTVFVVRKEEDFGFVRVPFEININGWGATSNYIPRSGYFDLSDDGLPEIGTEDFPRWVNHALLNDGGATYSQEPVLEPGASEEFGNYAPAKYRSRPDLRSMHNWYFVFPIGKELPEEADSYLTLAIRYGDDHEHRDRSSWQTSHMTFWQSYEGTPLHELRGKIVNSVRAQVPAP